MKLAWKIALGASLVSAIAFVGGALYVRPALKRDMTEQIARTLSERLVLIGSLVEQHFRGDEGVGDLQSWILDLAHGSNARISIIGPYGDVWADSSVSSDRLHLLENQAQRPEVLEAQRHGEGTAERANEAQDVELLYVARRVRLKDSWGVVRLAYPLAAINAAVERVQKILWVAVGISLIFAIMLSVLVSRWVASPLRELTDAAQRFARGDLSVRSHFSYSDEVGDLATSFNYMASKLAESIKALQSEREQAQRILSTLDEGILLLDERERVAAANPAFLKMFDVDSEFSINRSPLELVRADVMDRAIESMRKGDRFEEEFVLEAPLGERRFEFTAAPVLESGRRRGAVLVFRDVTRTRRLEEVRKDFVANVSHELRTPLTSIRGYAETLTHKLAGQEPLDRFAQSILRSAEALSALVNDLLDLSRLERPEFSIHKEPADLLKTLQGQIEQFQQRADQAGVRLLLSPGEFSHQAWFDRRLLGQAVGNLIDNALKYTPKDGRIDIITSQTPEGIKVEVCDTGPGVPEKDLPRLFERFYRVDKARSRELGGTGLGLAIVKHILTRHGGGIGVRNRPGGGACFWLILPQQSTQP